MVHEAVHLAEVVGGQQDRAIVAAGEVLAQLVEHLGAGQRIQMGERLVEHQQSGPDPEGDGEQQPGALPGREAAQLRVRAEACAAQQPADQAGVVVGFGAALGDHEVVGAPAIRLERGVGTIATPAGRASSGPPIGTPSTSMCPAPGA